MDNPGEAKANDPAPPFPIEDDVVILSDSADADHLSPGEANIVRAYWVTISGLHRTPSQNLTIVADIVEFGKDACLDTSGEDVLKTPDPKPMKLNGRDGIGGGDGMPGPAAGSVTIFARTILGTPKIKATGGAGSQGQDGGDGAPGSSGYVGGHKSVAGGNAGAAGRGGAGGLGGNVLIRLLIEERSKLSPATPQQGTSALTVDAQLQGGQGGKPGVPGKPGDGVVAHNGPWRDKHGIVHQQPEAGTEAEGILIEGDQDQVYRIWLDAFPGSPAPASVPGAKGGDGKVDVRTDVSPQEFADQCSIQQLRMIAANAELYYFNDEADEAFPRLAMVSRMARRKKAS